MGAVLLKCAVYGAVGAAAKLFYDRHRRRRRRSPPSAPGPTEEDHEEVENVSASKLEMETSVVRRVQAAVLRATQLVEQAVRGGWDVPTEDLEALANENAMDEQTLQRELRHLNAQGQLANAVVASKEEDAVRYPCPDFLKGFETSGCVNVAVVGGQGVGKSSFINAILGLKRSDPRWAKTGVNETTLFPTMYEMPYFGGTLPVDHFDVGNFFLLTGDGPATANLPGASSASGDAAAGQRVKAAQALGSLCTMLGHAEHNQIRVRLVKDQEERTVSKEQVRLTSGVFLWDLPGVGTPEIPQDTYIQTMGIRYFDVVLMMNDRSFTEAENLLVRELKQWEVPFFAIRNKIDEAIRSQLAEYDEVDADQMSPTKRHKTGCGRHLSSSTAASSNNSSSSSSSSSTAVNEAQTMAQNHLEALALCIWETCRTKLLENTGAEQVYLISTLPKMREFFDFRQLCDDVHATARARRSRRSDNHCPVCFEEFAQRQGTDRSCLAWRCSHLLCRGCSSQVSICPQCRLPKAAPSKDPPPKPRLPLHLLIGVGVSPPNLQALEPLSLLPPSFTFVPDQISLRWAEGLQRRILDLSGQLVDDFFPEVVISYATGTRKDIDEPDTGPGMVYAAELALRLHDAGVATFSGLSIPPGENWKIIILRIAGRLVEAGKRTPAKVLLVVETPAFYRSQACLEEVSAAIKNRVHILPVALEKPKPEQNNMWENLRGNDRNGHQELMIYEGAQIMSNTNGLPPRQTLLDLPDAIGQVVDSIKGRISATADMSAALGAARVPQQQGAS